MITIAHRGANREALENSWEAFEAAIEAPCQRIELDVQATRDSVPIIMHDDNLQRTTGHSLRLAETDYEEIRGVKLNNGESIPTLDEALDRLLPRVELNVEIKERSASGLAAIADSITNATHRDKIIVSSFWDEPLAYFRDNVPGIARACLWGTFELEARQLGNLAPQIMMERYDTDIFHPYSRLMGENLMEQARLRGWTVYPWDSMVGMESYDPEGTWTLMKTLEVDGFCTNMPRRFSAWLREAEVDESRFR